MSDASFHDADGHGPLALRAETPDELPILSALCQDAVLTVGDIRYDGTARSLASKTSKKRYGCVDANSGSTSACNDRYSHGSSTARTRPRSRCSRTSLAVEVASMSSVPLSERETQVIST